MRTIVPLDDGSYSYAGMGYANPHAVTQIANGLSTTTYSYDQNGNLSQKTTDGVTTTYLWDYANRLIALGSGGATTTYGYDAFGSRVFQTTATSTTIYPFKWYSVASSTGSGATYATTTEYVFNGDTLLATVDQQTAERRSYRDTADQLHPPRPSRLYQRRDQRERHGGADTRLLPLWVNTESIRASAEQTAPENTSDFSAMMRPTLFTRTRDTLIQIEDSSFAGSSILGGRPDARWKECSGKSAGADQLRIRKRQSNYE